MTTERRLEACTWLPQHFTPSILSFCWLHFVFLSLSTTIHQVLWVLSTNYQTWGWPWGVPMHSYFNSEFSDSHVTVKNTDQTNKSAMFMLFLLDPLIIWKILVLFHLHFLILCNTASKCNLNHTLSPWPTKGRAPTLTVSALRESGVLSPTKDHHPNQALWHMPNLLQGHWESTSRRTVMTSHSSN